MKNLLGNSVVAMMILTVTACTDNTLYHSYQYIPKKGWKGEDTLSFEVYIPDSFLTYYHVSAHIRNRNDYPYQNLLLLIDHNLQDSSAIVTDTIRCMLADEEGWWTGMGWGDLYQTVFDVGNFTTDRSGKRTVKITHGMKDDTLVGINDVGIQIEKQKRSKR
jgi:gliding motility-associated lipoprotein GldH